MDKFVVTYVDAHVAKCLSHGVEKHQVARLQIFLVNFFGSFGLFACTARQCFAQSLLVHGAYKTTAIKTVVIGAAAAVRNA